MALHRTLWRRDFSAVPAEARRAARLALQWIRNDPQASRQLADRNFLGALWLLTQPLLDPRAVANSLVIKRGEEDAPDSELVSLLEGHPSAEWDDLDPLELDGEARQWLRDFFQTLPRWVLNRLAAADAAAPATPTVALLGEILGLDAASVEVLEFVHQREQSQPLRLLLRASGQASARTNLERLAMLLGQEAGDLRAVFAKGAPLGRLGLLESRQAPGDMEDMFPPSDLLRELLDAAPQDAAALLGLLIEPAPPAVWRLDSFAHLAAAAGRLQGVLGQAAATGAAGVNALLYGPPGTGKTELARALAAACGLCAWQVRSADDDGDGLARRGRLSAYLLAQRLLARRRDALLIFDEVEDVLDTDDELFSFMRRRPPGRQKGWMNRILEENPVPTIWITNSTEGMDPAFLRRFLLPVGFTAAPRSVRRQLAEQHLGDRGLPPDLLDELAADVAQTPARLAAARRLLDLCPDAPPERTVREGVAALRTLLHGSPALRQRRVETAFDVAYLNLAGGIAPSAIARALHAQGRGSLCFYGPPGTGKTAFATVLAEALDRELVARQASDLLSAYVGETEHNLARLFRDSDPETTVLLLDEVDSFLSDRRQARHHWERTQVNELLQQMERYPGIFIAATNLMSGIDAAALRRFDFKLHFRTLTPVQRRALFAREALGDVGAPVPPDLARHLDEANGLTPGDFATVCRQRALLRETLTPEQFLRRLVWEGRLKGEEHRMLR
ncbi:AAA family ATPase [Candidatus Thiodictyon syntrophicum]|jgi:AAA+ superfamily predicted ATPase|uniref:AAA family ATPase n=1 Tax=Candidatus Thiodictyon syntrophicum TaxID=1166950 RepID=A0A2K8UHW0_9GAMM|nr:AAA family ATPase [Candidatus Thiodictyon syntrophicum]AUB85125.1 AAA family ATPase [Candidatus Thiodictyon syntrophicum]